jgi:hypothetical protein
MGDFCLALARRGCYNQRSNGVDWGGRITLAHAVFRFYLTEGSGHSGCSLNPDKSIPYVAKGSI